MNLEQALLLILMEECCEVGQRASKATRFGLLDVQKGQRRTNTTRLIGEWVDLNAVWELLHEKGFMRSVNLNNPIFRRMIAAKKKKVQKYLAYSAIMGRLNPQNPNYLARHEKKKWKRQAEHVFDRLHNFPDLLTAQNGKRR